MLLGAPGAECAVLHYKTCTISNLPFPIPVFPLLSHLPKPQLCFLPQQPLSRAIDGQGVVLRSLGEPSSLSVFIEGKHLKYLNLKIQFFLQGNSLAFSGRCTPNSTGEAVKV